MDSYPAKELAALWRTIGALVRRSPDQITYWRRKARKCAEVTHRLSFVEWAGPRYHASSCRGRSEAYDEAKRFADAFAIQPEPDGVRSQNRNSGFEDR
jgi:hypothetical protein